MKLDQYFIKFTENLAYLDLKETASQDLLKDLPLPIYIDDMTEGIATGQMKESIDLDKILTAMLINIGADKDFLYNEEYKIVLSKYLSNINKFAINKAMEIADLDINKALLILRGANNINPLDNYSAYFYARLLWPLAYESEEKYKDDFIREALRILQETIANDENFAISYYELGNIYANLGEYVKARNYYNKALEKTDSPEARDETYDRITEIDDNAEIEEALYFIGKSDFNNAIKKLTRLLSNKKRADAYYYLAVAYQNIGQYENSTMAFTNALDLGAEFRELYNDYAISLYMLKREKEALEIIEEGLEKFPQDPRLTYNKIQINLVMGNLSQGKKDIEELLSYDDLSDEIRENLKAIKEHYKI